MLQRIERIQNHRNVQGVILVNAEGNPIRSNMDNSTSLQYTRHAEELRSMTQHVVRDLDPEDELVVLRLRTRMNEVMILPERDQTVICIQACEIFINAEKKLRWNSQGQPTERGRTQANYINKKLIFGENLLTMTGNRASRAL
ncbi:dynein light chain [Echinococcus multilocularis]|uniref:Dynein light chain n=1 Tax=Echinococcus multilocularis TaxID=6211 RepID=A0A068YDR6_ECHMU|nr:dynein light chain [Echinococcus multilocularis]